MVGMENIEAGRLYSLNGKKVQFRENCSINHDKEGYVVLDMDQPCSEPDLTILPVFYQECGNSAERYMLFRDHVVLGRREALCFV